MKIKAWAPPQDQKAKLGRNLWNVSRLFELSRGLPVMDVPLDHLNVYYTYDTLSMRDMVMHFRAVQDADLDTPIILDEDGEIMDGRHRVMKAMFFGHTTIKAVRFDENPPPRQREES